MLATSAPIANVMRRSTVSVRPEATLREVTETLVREEIGAVVVKGLEGLVGIVSERDVVAAIAEGSDPDVERAGDVMTYDVTSVASADSIDHVARTMLDGAVRHLPVVDTGGPVGIVSIRDLLAVYVTAEG